MGCGASSTPPNNDGEYDTEKLKAEIQNKGYAILAKLASNDCTIDNRQLKEGQWYIQAGVFVEQLSAGQTGCFSIVVLSAIVDAATAAAASWDTSTEGKAEITTLVAESDFAKSSTSLRLTGLPEFVLTITGAEIAQGVYHKHAEYLDGAWGHIRSSLGTCEVAVLKEQFAALAQAKLESKLPAGEELTAQKKEEVLASVENTSDTLCWRFLYWHPRRQQGTGIVIYPDQADQLLLTGPEVVASAVVDAASSIFSVLAHVNPALQVVSTAVDAVSKLKSADGAGSSLKKSNSTPQERIDNFAKTSFALSGTALATVTSSPDAERLQLSVGKFETQEASVGIPGAPVCKLRGCTLGGLVEGNEWKLVPMLTETVMDLGVDCETISFTTNVAKLLIKGPIEDESTTLTHSEKFELDHSIWTKLTQLTERQYLTRPNMDSKFQLQMCSVSEGKVVEFLNQKGYGLSGKLNSIDQELDK